MNKTIKMLVVDDVEAIRTFIRLILLRMDYSHVDTACSAEDTLEKISASDYDVIFLDINLPNMNGLDLLNKLSEKNPDTKIIMCSGSSTESNVREAIDRGAIGFLVKPVTATNIEAALNRHLKD